MVGCGPAERDGCAGGGCLDVVGDRVEGGGRAAQEAHADGAFESGEAEYGCGDTLDAGGVVGGEALHADLGEFGGEVGQGGRLPVGSAGGQLDVAGQAAGLEPGEAGLADGGQVGREAGADRARELDPQRGRVLLAQVEDFGAVEDRVVRGDVQRAGQAGEFGCHGAGGAGGPQVRRADLECLQADRVGGRRGHGHEGFAGQVAQDGVGGALGYVELAGDLGERHRRPAVCQPVEDSRRPDDRGAHDAPFSRLRGWLSRPAACPREVLAGSGFIVRLPGLPWQACERVRMGVCQRAFIYTTAVLI